MAWTHIGSWATGSSTSSGTTLQIFRPAAVTEVNSTLILNCAADNISTTTGETSDHTSITDTGGNAWIKMYEYTYSPTGAAGDGVTNSTWYLPVTTQVVSGGSITVNFGSAITSKSAVVRKFSCADAARVHLASVPQTATIANGDAPSITISGLVSAEYLFWRSIASETNGTGLSVTASYTSGGGLAANTGTAGTSVVAVGEFRILTGTGDTSNPGHGSADQLGVFFALSDQAVSLPPNQPYLYHPFLVR